MRHEFEAGQVYLCRGWSIWQGTSYGLGLHWHVPLILSQAAEGDLTSADELHGGYGSIAEECDELRNRMCTMRLHDKKHDKGLYGRMFGRQV